MEIEKLKLEKRIQLEESGWQSILGSAVLNTVFGSSSSKKSKALDLAQNFAQAKLKEQGFLEGKKGTLGIVVVGSIIGGILAAKKYYDENS